jgi:Ca2+-binding EF-hand superfamily protein
LDYSFERSLDPVPGDSFKEVQEIKRQLGAKLPETAFEVCKRVFFIFDEDKNGFISRSEVQRGISYLGVEGLIVAPSQTTVDSVFDSCIQMRDKNGIKVRKEVMDQLRFADFLRLFLTIKAVGSSVMAR